MISVSDATDIVLNNLGDFGTESIPLVNATGRILKEKIHADRPFPPFDRVMMDGIAIHYDNYLKGQKSFQVAGVQLAGMSQCTLSNNIQCLEVMTGTMLPNGTDTVIPYEETRINKDIATIISKKIVSGQNIHIQGSDKQKDEVLLHKNQLISPAEIATLAAVGKHKVEVAKHPTVALISTGDELVDVHSNPQPHQIRKTNIYALVASLAEIGIPSKLYHLSDSKREIEQVMSKVLSRNDVVIMSGGVSKGKKDYIPEVLELLGVNKFFHKVKQRPGKPFWFGKSANTTVFALPGNPVSTFVCFYKYIKPWLEASLGITDTLLSEAILQQDFTFDKPLTYFLQVRISTNKGIAVAYPIPGHGSGDFTNLNLANGFLELPEQLNKFQAGKSYPFIPFRPQMK